MAYRQKTIVAGSLVVQALYPMASGVNIGAVRAGRKHLSSDAQRRMNLKYAWQKLELLIAANFRRGDLWITLTYDDTHLPGSRREACAQAQAFFDRLRTRRKRAGRELKYIYCTEHKHGDGRWHHHALINRTDKDYADILSAWGRGAVDIRAVRITKTKTYETLSRYMCKEPRDKLGHRLWSSSRNLAKPESYTETVPETAELRIPKGVRKLDDTGIVKTLYGRYRYVKYLARGWSASSKSRRC